MTPLRNTFNQSADRYHRARPGYPEELFDDLTKIADLTDLSRILEIGPGTGLASVELAKRGYHFDGIELGEDLANEARRNLAAFPRAKIYTGEFEAFPIEMATYDLVFAATAFHWIRQPEGFEKMARILKPKGLFFEFRHHHVWTPESDEFIQKSQLIYRKFDPDTPDNFRLPMADEVPTLNSVIEASGLFEIIENRRYLLNIEHNAESFADLLWTFSNHIALPEPNRSLLIDGIAGIIRTLPSERITKTLLIILHAARRQGA